MSEKVLGYYSHLEHALNAYVKLAMADDDFNATSIEEVKVLLTEIKEQIHAEWEDRKMNAEIQAIAEALEEIEEDFNEAYSENW